MSRPPRWCVSCHEEEFYTDDCSRPYLVDLDHVNVVSRGTSALGQMGIRHHAAYWLDVCCIASFHR